MPGNKLKGKRDVMETAYTTPLPYNVIFSESKGPIRTDKEFLHYGFYKFVGTITRPGTKKSKEIASSMMEKAAVGGETRVVKAFHKDADFDIVEMLPLKNDTRRFHGLETRRPSIFH